ncbi:cyclin-dependent protein kinase Pho85p [Monosporozyma unispora]|nr:hypothetical protein C6P44_004356 [Kazachstania unispora]
MNLRILKEKDDNIEDVELVYTTKFARIFKYKSRYAIKCIETDIVIAPHNPQFELSILKKLSQLKHNNVIDLLEYRKVPVNDELELCFEWFPSTLAQFMESHWELKTFKKRFNPYYSMDLDQMESNEGTIEYINTLDVNEYCFPFFKQLINGLSFIHTNGIIHRDIKPENILIRLNDPIQLIITDFGISYDTTDSKQILHEPIDSKICDISTSFYKAPELLFSVKNYSTSVDIWSLGIIVTQWFAMSGRFKTIPGLFDNGVNEVENGSDIRLIMSIFDKMGIPSINEWDEVLKYGSGDAFIGLFGSNGDGNYIFNKPIEEQSRQLIEYLPRLEELRDHKKMFINCLLGMLQLQSTMRWNCTRINEEILR